MTSRIGAVLLEKEIRSYRPDDEATQMMFARFAKLAADYVALLDASLWIPVWERLPEIGTEVLAWVEGHDGGYADLRIYTPEGGEWYRATHWKATSLSPPEPEKQ